MRVGSPRSVSRPLLVSFAARMRAQSPRVEQRSKRLRLPVRSRRKRGVTGFTGTAIASVIGSLSSVLCLPALLALEPGNRELTALG